MWMKFENIDKHTNISQLSENFITKVTSVTFHQTTIKAKS